MAAFRMAADLAFPMRPYSAAAEGGTVLRWEIFMPIKNVADLLVATLGAVGAGTDRQLTSHLRLAGRGECRHFLMAHMHPFDRAAAAQCLREAVEAIAHNAEDTLDPGLLHGNLHLINGLFDAHRSRVPVPAIAAQIPSAEKGLIPQAPKCGCLWR
jgi:hypothetical protein